MTPKIIELKQAPVVLVGLSERPVEVKDSYANGFIYKDKKGYIESEYLEDYCDWEDSKLVGILSDLTEEQFAECVDWYDYSHEDDLTALYAFKDYVNGIKEANDYWDEYPFDAAKESFYSLLESENVYTENPHGKEPEYVITQYGVLPEGYKRFENDHNKWQEAQSRTIDPTQTVVLLRKEGA